MFQNSTFCDSDMADWNDCAFIEYYDKYAEEVHCDIGTSVTSVKHTARSSKNSHLFRGGSRNSRSFEQKYRIFSIPDCMSVHT